MFDPGVLSAIVTTIGAVLVAAITAHYALRGAARQKQQEAEAARTTAIATESAAQSSADASVVKARIEQETVSDSHVWQEWHRVQAENAALRAELLNCKQELLKEVSEARAETEAARKQAMQIENVARSSEAQRVLGAEEIERLTAELASCNGTIAELRETIRSLT